MFRESRTQPGIKSLYAFSSGAGLTHFGKGASLTLGISYSAGKGKAQIPDDASQVQDCILWSIFLSNSYGFQHQDIKPAAPGNQT